jgi:hypothetical protein
MKTPFLRFIDYVEYLAVSHSEVLHDPKSQPRFVGVFDSELVALSSNEDEIIIQATDVNGKVTGDSDTMIPEIMTGIIAWCARNKTDDHDAEREAFEKSFRIGSDFIARMAEDSAEGCEVLTGFDSNRVTFSMVGPHANNLVGYWFQFPLRDPNYLIEYDESIWQ